MPTPANVAKYNRQIVDVRLPLPSYYVENILYQISVPNTFSNLCLLDIFPAYELLSYCLVTILKTTAGCGVRWL